MIPDLSKIREMAEQFRATGGEMVLPVETVLALLDHIDATDKLLALRTANLAGVAEERDALDRRIESYEADREYHEAQRQKIMRLEDLTRDLKAERDTLTTKLAEARRVIEPFGMIADRLETQAVLSLRDGAPITIHSSHCKPLPPVDFSRFRAARQWLQGDGK